MIRNDRMRLVLNTKTAMQQDWIKPPHDN